MSEMRHGGAKFSQEDKLEQAIRQLRAGESLEGILAEAGSDAGWLEPLLIAAAELRQLRQTVPVSGADASLARFLREAERFASDLPLEPSSRPWWERLADSIRLPHGGYPRLATAIVSASLALVALVVGGALFLGTSSTASAQSVLPGRPLYLIKRLGEDLYLWLPQKDERRDARSAEYEERRRDEVDRLLDQRLNAHVSFQGVVEALDANQVMVSGIVAQTTAKTQVEGSLTVGAQVSVTAHTTKDGILFVERVVVEEPAPPAPTPSPTAKFQPTPTPTTVSSQSDTPSPTPTPTVTAARIQEPTPTPGPTATSSPAPAETPIQSQIDVRDPTATFTPTLEPEAVESPPESQGEDVDLDLGNGSGGGEENEGTDDSQDHDDNDNDNSD